MRTALPHRFPGSYQLSLSSLLAPEYIFTVVIVLGLIITIHDCLNMHRRGSKVVIALGDTAGRQRIDAKVSMPPSCPYVSAVACRPLCWL